MKGRIGALAVSRWPSAVLAYGVGVLGALAALALTRALVEPLGGVYFAIPLCAVGAIALLLGQGPGVLAGVLVVTVVSLVLEPGYHSSAASPGGIPGSADLRHLVYALTTAFVTALGAREHSARQQLARLGRQARAEARGARADAESLRAWGMRTEAILDSITDGFLAIDSADRFLYVNPAAEGLLSKAKEGLLGREIWALYPVLRGSELDTQLARVRREGGPAHFEYHSPVSGRWFDAHLHPLQQGGACLYFRDVSARKRAEEALGAANERARRLIDSNIVGVAIGDLRGRIVEANDSFLRFVGYPREALEAGRLWVQAITPPKRREQQRAMARAVRRVGTVTPFEFSFLRPDGREVWGFVGGAMLPGDLVLSFVLDIDARKRAEREVSARERLFATAQRAAHIGSFELRPGSAELVWSEEMYAIFGVSPDAFRPTLEAVLERVVPEDRETLARALNVGGPPPERVQVRYRARRPDGSLRYVEIVGERQPDPLRLAGIALDRTEREEAERRVRESEERLRVIAETSQDLILRYRYSEPRGYEYVSPAATALTGYTPEEHYRDPDLGFNYVLPEYVRSIRPEPGDVPPTTLVLRWRHKDGRVVWAEERMTWFRGPCGEVEAMICIARDISATKRAEEEQREAARRKDEFLGMLSHELRNPLAPIRSSLFLLQRPPPSEPRAQRSLAVIERQVDHLTRLVDDLLDITRITRGKIRLQRGPVDLAALARRVGEDQRSLFEAAGVALAVEVPQWPLVVDGDAARLAQVAGNLLQNAAKFTPRGGRVALRLRGEGGAVALEVSDTGIGMDAEMIGRLFQPFAQADRSLDRSRGGLGLGLSLVKAIVELHGGTVQAESAGEGRGATFRVRLPLRPGLEPEVERPPSAPASVERARRVLVIEDNRDAADSLREALEASGYEVLVAYAGPEGLALALGWRPQAVLCDVGLPGMDGYAVARALRERAEGRPPRLVALTGYALPEDRRRAAAAGFELHLAKPPRLEVLDRILSGAAPREAWLGGTGGEAPAAP